ncbi:MAG: peptidylprolyl isomerase [Armatimonadota bacterium]
MSMQIRARSAVWGLALALTAAAGAGGWAQSPDSAVLRVGERKVTRADLDRYLLQYFGKPGVEQLIDHAVIESEAERLKVEVSPEEADEALTAARTQANVQFQAALKAEGITEETWKERARFYLLAEKVLDAKWPVKEQDLVRLSVRYARLQNENVARNVIKQARNGANFQTLVLQWSEDKERAGMVQPDPFLRVENPAFFKMAEKLRVGQVTPQPIQSGEFWLVVKLEKQLAPNTLSTKERELAQRKVKAFRTAALLPSTRRRFKIEYPTVVASLVSDPRLPNSTPVAVVTPTAKTGGEARTFSRGQLLSYLLTHYGARSLDRLAERSLVEQEAQRLRVGVSEAELNARVGEAKGASRILFDEALKGEGITEEAFKERLRYLYLAERVLAAREPLAPEELERLTVRAVRVKTRAEAEQLLQRLGMGARFEDAVRLVSLDRGGDGLLQPRAFLSIDNPTVFKAVGDTPEGAILPEPLQVEGFWYVLRLEKRHPAPTLTGRERENALRRIYAPRIGKLLEALRADYSVEQAVPLKTLISEAAG